MFRDNIDCVCRDRPHVFDFIDSSHDQTTKQHAVQLLHLWIRHNLWKHRVNNKTEINIIIKKNEIKSNKTVKVEKFYLVITTSDEENSSTDLD